MFGFLSQLSSWDEDDFQLHVSIAIMIIINEEYPICNYFVNHYYNTE